MNLDPSFSDDDLYVDEVSQAKPQVGNIVEPGDQSIPQLDTSFSPSELLHGSMSTDSYSDGVTSTSDSRSGTNVLPSGPLGVVLGAAGKFFPGILSRFSNETDEESETVDVVSRTDGQSLRESTNETLTSVEDSLEVRS